MKLVLKSIQMLANGASILRFSGVENGARLSPGLLLHFARDAEEFYLPVMRAESSWLELYDEHALAEMRVGEYIEVLFSPEQPLQAPGANRISVLVGDDAGMASVIFAAQKWMRKRTQGLCLLQLNKPLSFKPRPSQIMLPMMPPGVIACVPLLEDWGVATRLSSDHFLPGVHQGSWTTLLQHWLSTLNEDEQRRVLLTVVGGEKTLQQAKSFSQLRMQSLLIAD